MDAALTRRRLILLGAVVPAGVLTACGDDQGTEAGEREVTIAQADVGVLNFALDLEHMAYAAYAAAAPRLDGDERRMVRTLRDQEAEHADALAAAIRDRGGRPNPAREDYRFPPLSTRGAVLRFAVSLEDTAVAAYLDALPKLSDPELRATAASIVTNEAQHMALLRSALGADPVPEAFVVGRSA